MFRNYLRVAFRNLLGNRAYVIINALGVGIAFACCLAVYMVIAYSLEFDDFHAARKVERIFKLHTLVRSGDGVILPDNSAPMALPSIAVPEVAGIERFTRYIHEGAYIRRGDQAFTETISFADSTFFTMFDFPLIAGDHTAFRNKHSVVLSEAMARKYFGNADAIGKMLVINFRNEAQVEVLVGGVLRKLPINNTFNFDVMMRIENFQEMYQLTPDNWSDNRDPSVFFELVSSESAASVDRALNRYLPLRNDARKDAVAEAYQLEHFKTRFTRLEVNASNTNQPAPSNVIVIFALMAGVILLIACFNLTNTTIAMTSRRLKEIGIRKSIGAVRRQIIVQFLVETIMMIMLSLGLGLVFSRWLVPAFNSLYNVPFSFDDVSGLNLVITLLVLVFVTALVAGIYPAVLNSKFKPIALLKNTVRVNGTNAFTRTLITLQFTISVMVLIGGVVFTQNATFQQMMNFGYDKDMIINVSVQNTKEFEAMENVIASHPGIMQVSASTQNIGQSSYEAPVKVGIESYTALHVGVGKNYFETMGLQLYEGRYPDVGNASDREEAAVVNRAFVTQAGMEHPLEHIVMINEARRRIVGVVENHVEDVFISDTPPSFVFYAAPAAEYTMMQVKTEVGNLAETKVYLENTWKRLFPGRPFESQLQEDVVMADARMVTSSFQRIFLFLTLLGGLLSVSGIFSLASLNVARRTKEIGIRKTLGAGVVSIITLLNKEFVIILSFAAGVGGFAGFYLVNTLLDMFNMMHAPVAIPTIVFCGAAIFVAGIVSTGLTILSAARTNPVETLRNE